MQRAFWILLFVCIAGGNAFAVIFGTVRGIVHDPQHRPIANANVVLKATVSDYQKTTQADAEGNFQFDAVPLGEYTVTVSATGFVTQEQRVTVLSGTAPILHFELRLPTQTQSVTVSAEASSPQTESVTPTTLVNRVEIEQTPGATRSNSLAMITNYVPGAYFTHDQLHVRGGHQVSWLVDGVPIPNTNIASNLGPQVDPKDIDAVEMQRGSYAADFGDRTYGIFDVLPRTGFDRNNEAELTLNAGNFYQTDDQINFGGHSSRFAYYASANGNRTNLGLQTPTSAVIHDAANGSGGFVSLIYNADSQDQLRFVAQARRDFYQVPFDPNNPLNSPGENLRDANRESDSFAAFSWVRTFSPGLVLTVSPFFHYNSADYVSDPNDFPSAATQKRSSKYEGGQATLSWIKGPNNARAGLYSFAQQDDQFFHVVYNDGSGTVTPLSQNPYGSLIALYIEDQIKVNSWLTLNGGLRQTHFSGAVVENATSPRVGASLRIPKLNWVFRGFYGHFYQAPALGTLFGPTLNDIQTQQQLDFVPLRGERDEEHQFGLTIPIKGWTVDADNFLTRANNFFDHNALNSSNVFFPVDVQGARINGWELTLRSPRIQNRAQVYLTYSNQLALGFGCVIGGLIGSCATPPPGFFLLDHDQRNTLHLGGQYTLPWRAYASTDVYYGTGFSNSNPAIPGDHLQPHTTIDLSLGKEFGERLSASLSATNVANRRVLLDNSFTFGGTHFLNPREIFVQVRYRFHY